MTGAVLAERSAAHPGATHHCWALHVALDGRSDRLEPAGEGPPA